MRASLAANPVNPSTATGEIGVSLNFGAGNALQQANNLEFLKITFNVVSNAPSGQTLITIENSPTDLEVSNTPARPVVTAFSDGAVHVLAPSAAGVSVSGRVFAGEFSTIPGVLVMLTDSDGNTFATRTNSFGCFKFIEIPAGQTYTLSLTHKRYTLNSQVLSISDNVVNLNVFAEK